MMRLLPLLFLLCLSFDFSFSDTVIWRGEVNSNGTPTLPINLILGNKYQFKVSRMINLGKWREDGEPLANDACYEFDAGTPKMVITPSKVDSFKNSMGISVCDGKFHFDHHYQSSPFEAKQNRVHFWIYDTDYSDNRGALHVEVIQLD